MTMSGAERENHYRQMARFESRMDKMVELLEALVKQGEEITKLAEDVERLKKRFGLG